MGLHVLRLLAVIALAAGCEAPLCNTDDNCPQRLPFCSSGVCSAVDDGRDDGAGEEGEGEGEAGEGEGEGEERRPFTPENVALGPLMAFASSILEVFPTETDGFVFVATAQPGSVDGAGEALPAEDCDGQACPQIFGASAAGGFRWHVTFRFEGVPAHIDVAVLNDVVFVAGRATEVKKADGSIEETPFEFLARFNATTGELMGMAPITIGPASTGLAVVGDRLIYANTTGNETITLVAVDTNGEEVKHVDVIGRGEVVPDGVGFALNGAAQQIVIDGVQVFSTAQERDFVIHFDADLTVQQHELLDGLVVGSVARKQDGIALVRIDDELVAYDSAGIEQRRTLLPLFFDDYLVPRPVGFWLLLVTDAFPDGVDVPVGDTHYTSVGSDGRDVVLVSIDDDGVVRNAVWLADVDSAATLAGPPAAPLLAGDFIPPTRPEPPTRDGAFIASLVVAP